LTIEVLLPWLAETSFGRIPLTFYLCKLNLCKLNRDNVYFFRISSSLLSDAIVYVTGKVDVFPPGLNQQVSMP